MNDYGCDGGGGGEVLQTHRKAQHWAARRGSREIDGGEGDGSDSADDDFPCPRLNSIEGGDQKVCFHYLLLHYYFLQQSL